MFLVGVAGCGLSSPPFAGGSVRVNASGRRLPRDAFPRRSAGRRQHRQFEADPGWRSRAKSGSLHRSNPRPAPSQEARRSVRTSRHIGPCTSCTVREPKPDEVRSGVRSCIERRAVPDGSGVLVRSGTSRVGKFRAGPDSSMDRHELVPATSGSATIGNDSEPLCFGHSGRVIWGSSLSGRANCGASE